MKTAHFRANMVVGLLVAAAFVVVPAAALGGNIVCQPDVLQLTSLSPTGGCDVVYLGGGGGLLYAYSIVFTWDGGVAGTVISDVAEGELLEGEGSTFFSPRVTGPNEITVDCALLGGEGGATGPGTMFTIEFSAIADGTCDLDITIIEVRDKDNNPLSGFEEEDGLIEVDLTIDEPPVITSAPILTATVEQPYVYDVDATGTPAPVYALADFPGGMQIDELTGLIEWTPGAGQAGPNPVEVVATNTAGADTQSFTVAVTEPSGANIVCVPDTLRLTADGASETVAIEYLGGGDGLLYGYSIRFTWDGGTAETSTGQVHEGSLLSSTGSTAFFTLATGPNEITVDCALLGGGDGVAGPGTMFTIDFAGIAEGTGALDVTIVDVRDKDNVSLSGFSEEDGTILVLAGVSDTPTMTAEPQYTAGTGNTVCWSDESSSGAVGYYAECATDAGFTADVQGSGWTATIHHAFSGLADGQLHYYRVKSRNSLLVESPWSNTVYSTQDATPPVTSCDDPSEYQTALTFPLTYVAVDATSGVQFVELWYQLDGGGYVQFTLGSPFTSGTIDFTAPSEGHYDFYTVGTDGVVNVELAPGVPDCSTIVDMTPPEPPVAAPEPPYTPGSTNEFHWSVPIRSPERAAGWYAESSSDDTFGTAVVGSGWITQGSHVFIDLGDGTAYYYRVKEQDAAGHESDWSNVVNSTQDASPPVTSCDDPGSHQNTLSFELTYAAFDATSGVQYVELWYQVDGGGYVQYTDGSPFTGGTIQFTAPSGGTYDFYSIGTDNVENVEAAPGTPDCSTVVDAAPPDVSDVHIANLTLTHTDDYIKNGDAVQITAVVTDVRGLRSVASIKADLTGLGGGAAVDPDSYTAGLATWSIPVVVCDPGDGTVTVTVTATDDVGNLGQGSDGIAADNTAPTAVDAFDAEPGHGKCDLSWTNGYDVHLAGVAVVRQAESGAYPLYAALATDWPNIDSHYPGTHVAGVTVYDGTETSAADVVAERNVYYYQAFCYDEAHNYGPAANTARDLATNYWLGDFTDGSGGYDGLADFEDLMFLSLYYGATNPSGPAAECDIGPTVHPDGGSFGVPMPDRYVGFDDLMIYSLNYATVGPTRQAPPRLPNAARRSGLVLSLYPVDAGTGGQSRFALRIEGNRDELKGISALVVYDPAELSLETVRPSDHLDPSVADVFFWHGDEPGRVRIDLAALGAGVTISGCGDLAELSFACDAGGQGPILESGEARDVNNRSLDIELLNGSESTESLRAFRLLQNAPNPFNPITNVAFETPVGSHVSIYVHDVCGRRVATLTDEWYGAGLHAVVWDATDGTGLPLGSGIYFCTMKAVGKTYERKMLLIK